MSGFEHLTERYLEGDATRAEMDELGRMLERSGQMPQFLSQLELQQLLLTFHAPTKEESVEAILNQLRREADPFVESVARELHSTRLEKDAISWPGRLLEWFGLRRMAITLCGYAGVILIACVVLWFLSATMGEPVLAGLSAGGVSVERSTETIMAVSGMRLRESDVLSTGTNGTATVTFGSENTQVEVGPQTELKVSSFARGKRFELGTGTLRVRVARQRLFQPMIVRTPHAEARVLGTRFTLQVRPGLTELEVTEGKVGFTRATDGRIVKVSATNYIVAGADYEMAALPTTGRILREYWTNQATSSISAAGSRLRSKRSNVAPPDGYDYLSRFESTPLGADLRVTERIRGYVHPRKTGLYRIALTTVHVETVLLLSRTDQPRDVVQVAFRTPGGVGPSLQQVTPVPLQAGRRYYIEVVHESDGGDDQLAVTWQAPEGEPEIIPGRFLSPVAPQEKGHR